jgi:8-oxo-dGTP diphosphatase
MANELDKFPKPSVTVDVIIFTLSQGELKVLLVKRNLEPFKDKWAIPGGFVRIHESLHEAAKRELEEETGVKDVYLEQLYTFGDPKRDPRGRVITVSYLALINSDTIKLKASTDASEVKWFSIKEIPFLAFDHKKIIEYALKRLKWKFEYTTVAFSLLQKKFSIGEVQRLYEIVFDKEFDKRNFAKKLLSLNILKEEGIRRDVSYRPPMTYSLKKGISEVIEIIHSQQD